MSTKTKTESKAAHTPGPWAAKNWRICANFEDGNPLPIKVICDTAHNKEMRTEENEANAEFIVRACNAHDEFVQAAEHAVDLIEAWMNGILAKSGITWESEDDHPPALKELRAAIAKAREQP